MNDQIKQFDTIVVGSGISGMSMSLLLAQTGQKVLMIEQDTKIGGSMQRFKRRGIPFDTGFHFTAGFGDLMSQMLKTLGIETAIEPVYFTDPGGARIFFESSGKLISFPRTRDKLAELLVQLYPDEAELVQQFFRDEANIFQKTPTMNLQNLENLLGDGTVINLGMIEEDFISLEKYFNNLGMSTELRTILSMFAMCHGTPPNEISFANHCRVSYGLHNGIAQVKHGGDAFIQAFTDKANELGIEIRCNCTIAECLEINNREAKLLKLSDNSTVKCDQAVLAIHPDKILKILPDKLTNKMFIERVNEFDDTFGFFSLHAVTTEHVNDFPVTLTSYFSSTDISRIMSPLHADSGMAIMTALEETDQGQIQIVNAFEAMWMNECEQWKKLKKRRGNAEYQAYKKAYADKIIKKIINVYPQLAGKLEVLETATILTYDDYLNGNGAAYGVKQKIGQFNLFGKLPLRNFYAVGQSSLLPGVIGAMLSSFIICNKIIGNEKFKTLIKRIEQ